MHEIVNTEQAGAWDGPQGDVWVAREPMLNAALAQHTARLLEAAAVQPTDQVLDVGCGTGDTTRACARRAVEGEAMGVDLSSAMLRRARVRADEAGLRNVSFVQGDAQVHPFDAGRFDVVLSRFGVMFFADPVAAFANLARATKRGGRFVAAVWQPVDRNQWVVEPRAALVGGRDVPPMPEDVPGPFGLADGERTCRLLTEAGWSDVGLDDIAVPYYFGADTDAATAHAREVGMLRAVLDQLDDDETERAVDRLRAVMREHESPDGVRLESRAWVVHAVR